MFGIKFAIVVKDLPQICLGQLFKNVCFEKLQRIFNLNVDKLFTDNLLKKVCFVKLKRHVNKLENIVGTSRLID